MERKGEKKEGKAALFPQHSRPLTAAGLGRAGLHSWSQNSLVKGKLPREAFVYTCSLSDLG